jgi:hypothetical protein
MEGTERTENKDILLSPEPQQPPPSPAMFPASQIIVCDNTPYYDTDDIRRLTPSYFADCKTNRLIVERKCLTLNDHIFAIQKGNGWSKTSANNPKSKLLICVKWVMVYLPQFKELCAENIRMPPLVELSQEARFRTADGKVANIEIRGEIGHNTCVFRGKDIAKYFNIPNLLAVVSNPSIYIKYVDFVVFIGKGKGKTVLFITLEGMFKLLYMGNNPNAQTFRIWATSMFESNMNSARLMPPDVPPTPTPTPTIVAPEVNEEYGANYQMIKSVFACNTSKTPVVYLYSIGKANDLLEGNYLNGDLLCKFGCTNDLERRCGEHFKTYRKEFDTNIQLLCFSVIELKYIFDAETNIKQYFKSSLVDYNGSRELCIINTKEISKIRQYYGLLQNSYIGRFEEMNAKISGLEKEILELNHLIKIKEKDYEIMKLSCSNEYKTKETELMKFRLKLMEFS